MKNIDHNKIIKRVASKTFKQYGIKQKGQSRLFIDDNDWFLIIIEFQPSKLGNGTYLNIGINFNWNVQDYFSFDIGNREKEFVECINEEQFTEEINKLCKHSIEKACNYKNKFRDINNAEKIILKHNFTSDELWGNYHRGIISGLVGNKNNSSKYFNKLLEVPENNIEWIIELKKQIKGLMDLATKNTADFTEKIQLIIRETRKLKKLEDKKIIIEHGTTTHNKR